MGEGLESHWKQFKTESGTVHLYFEATAKTHGLAISSAFLFLPGCVGRASERECFWLQEKEGEGNWIQFRSLSESQIA